MPRGDGTGPMGMGPLTGRAFGFCAGFRTPGFVNPGTGAGLGRGCGYGRGFRRMSSFGTVPAGYSVFNGAFASAETEKEYLTRQADFMENQLEQVKKRLEKLRAEQE